MADAGGPRWSRWLIVVVTTLVALQISSLTQFGRYIPQSGSLEWDYLKGAGIAGMLLLALFLLPVRDEDLPWLVGAWLARIGLCLGVMLFYEHHYDTLDSYSYFGSLDTWQLRDSWFAMGSATQTITQLCQFLRMHFMDSFHGIKVLFAFFGLMGTYLGYLAFVSATGLDGRALKVAFLFTPSILFWSSILGKDPCMVLGIGLHCWGMTHWAGRRRSLGWCATGLGLLIVALIRIWMVPILLAPTLVHLWGRVNRFSFRMLGFGVIGSSLFLGWVLLPESIKSLNLSDLLLQADTVSRSWNSGGSATIMNADISSIWGFLAYVPYGMFTALFRPLPGDVNNAFGVAAGLENLGLLVALVYGWARYKKAPLVTPGHKHVLRWLSVYVLCWGMVYSLISPQNLGTAVRFRLQTSQALIAIAALGLMRPTAKMAPPREVDAKVQS